jgi:hypothetical protein
MSIEPNVLICALVSAATAFAVYVSTCEICQTIRDCRPR